MKATLTTQEMELKRRERNTKIWAARKARWQAWNDEQNKLSETRFLNHPKVQSK